MNHGQQTAQVARQITRELAPHGLTVLFDHGDVSIDPPDRLGKIVSWLGERAQGNELAQLDIAVENATGQTIALIEIEEGSRSRGGTPTGAAPKVLLADLFATLFGDCITFGEKALNKTLDVGSYTTLIVLTAMSSEAKRAQMAELAGRVDAIRGGLTNGNAAIGRIVLDVYPENGLLDKVRALVMDARGQG